MVSAPARRALLLGHCGIPGAKPSARLSIPALSDSFLYPHSRNNTLTIRSFFGAANRRGIAPSPLLASLTNRPPISSSHNIGATSNFTTIASRQFFNTNINQKEIIDRNAAAVPDANQPGELAAAGDKPKAPKLNLRARLTKEKDETRKFSSLLEIWRLLRIAKPETVPILGACALLLTSSAVAISVPYTIGKVMNIVTSAPGAEETIFGLTMYQFFPVLGVVFTLGAAANFGRIVLLRVIGERVVSRMRTQLYRKTLGQEAEFFDANKVGDLTSRFIADTTIVGKSITQNLSDGLRAIISCIAGFTAMAWISPSLVLTILLAAPFIGGGALFYSRVARRLAVQSQRGLGALNRIGNERLENIRTIQGFVGEAQEVGRYNVAVRKLFQVGKQQAITDARFFSFNGWIGNMIVIGLLWHGGGLVQQGILTLGDLTTFMMYAVYAGTSVIGITGFLSELMKGVGAASRLFELEDRNPAIAATKGKPVTSAKGMIEFKDVDFAYPTRPDNQIFSKLTFAIPSGSNVCIVGPSGGGKSTVASLLLRFYDINSGTVKLNGVDISTLNAKSLRRYIGVVSQEPVLFSGTIAENIAYSNPRADRAAIVQAAARANCTFISKLQKGLDTEVGSRGTQLSGGQKQRIAIARALLKNPDILILDEATSALDAESELAVNAAVAQLMSGNMTTISIAHRLSTIKRSDKIIVLNNEGSVAEIGSFTELSADQNSAFTKLMEWQLSGGEHSHPPAAEPPHRVEVDEGQQTETFDEVEELEEEIIEREDNKKN
ncbi:P-loop containing nucleoside triphosphate hydrolase protein [Xylariaceae sp. FL1019]|nr:P-loop containing nucleoside triphosphate hydrolase protein [Xylariaceae sp. FL1019]